MDVAVPSNLERIRWMYGEDLGALRRDVTAVSVGESEARACQEDLYRRTGYLLDPHSAVAYAAHRRAAADESGPTVVLATAHPAKFPEVSDAVAGEPVPLPATLAAILHAQEHMRLIGPSLGELRQELERADD